MKKFKRTIAIALAVFGGFGAIRADSPAKNLLLNGKFGRMYCLQAASIGEELGVNAVSVNPYYEEK